MNKAIELCKRCGGSGKVLERDYIGYCGYNDCQTKWYEKDIVTSHRKSRKYPRGGYTFFCSGCQHEHFEERLIEWPKIPCPDCKAELEEFTKGIRKSWPTKTFRLSQSQVDLLIQQAEQDCDLIDRQQALIKSQRERIDKLQQALTTKGGRK